MSDPGPAVTSAQPSTIAGFLSPDECLQLRREMDASVQQEAEIWLGDEFGIAPESRRGLIAALSERAEKLVHDRLWEVMARLEEIYGCEITHLSAVTALIYRHGDHFAAHSDGGVDDAAPPEIARRRISLVVALNNGAGPQPDFTGGELRFFPRLAPGAAPAAGEENVDVRSEPGLLIAFASATVHQVVPVGGGLRYSLALWALAATP